MNIKAFLSNEFHACGCTNLEAVIAVLRPLMEWHDAVKERQPYSALYPHEGIFYLLAGILDAAGLAEHGTAIRCPFLTDAGKLFIKALRETPIADIEAAEGVAYDGLWYPGYA